MSSKGQKPHDIAHDGTKLVNRQNLQISPMAKGMDNPQTNLIISKPDQNKGPWIAKKSTNRRGQNIAAKQHCKRASKNEMQPQKRRERRGNTAGKTDGNRSRRSRQPDNPLKKIGKEPPKPTMILLCPSCQQY